MVLGAGRAEVGERQVVEVKVRSRVDGELGVTTPGARIRLSFLCRRGRDPLERFPAIDRLPDPACVAGKGAWHARIDAARVGRIEPEVLLETDSLDAADRRLPEGRERPRRRSGRNARA